MAVTDEKIKQVQAGIQELISGSPAVSKQEAEGAITRSLKNAPTGAVISSLTAPQTPPVEEMPVREIGLGSVYALTGLGAAQKLAEASGPIDKSTGISIPERGTATEKIATDRQIGINGAGDYEQFTYGLDDTRGAASPGEAVGDTYVANLRAGNAGLNIATGSTLNSMDGSDGNPAFFGGRYPLLNTVVAPFKVKIPQYNLEVQSETLDPEKLAFQIATMIGGRPVPTYIGYTNAGFDITEPWYSGLAKGTANMPINTADLLTRGFNFAVRQAKTAPYRISATMAKLFADKETRDVIDRALNNQMKVINDTIDVELAEPWNQWVNDVKLTNGTNLSEFATTTTKLAEGAPTVLAQVGLLYGIQALMAGSGLTPTATKYLTEAVTGGLFGLAQGEDNFQGLKDAPISPLYRMQRAELGAGASAALNSLGAWSMLGGKMAAAREFMTNYNKRMGQAALQGLAGMAGESLTETADKALSYYVTYNMGDDQLAERLDGYVMAAVLGAVGGIASIPANMFTERRQILKEQILAGKIAATAPDFVKDLKTAVDMLVERGYTKEAAFDVIAEMGSPEGQAYFKKKDREILMGVLNRLTPEAVQFAKNMGAEKAAQFVQEMNQLDAQVYKALPADLSDANKTMISRAMRGIASVVSYYQGDFKLPKFVLREGEPMAYSPEENTLYINPKSTGEAIDFQYIQNDKLKLLDPVQRGILHELGHVLDTQLGRGTNYKDFLPTYFDAISKVYGPEKMDKIQKSMNKPSDRLDFEKSENPKDVTEKQMAKLTGGISDKNTGEYFAYAVSRLGKQIGEVFGFGKSEVAQYVDAANIIASTINIPSIQAQLSALQKGMRDIITKNADTLKRMAEAQGKEELARKIQDFAAGDTDALTREEAVALYDILQTYTSIGVSKTLNELFDGVNPETFMQRTEREFGESITTNGTVGELRKKIQARENRKNAKQEAELKVVKDALTPEGQPTFFEDTDSNNELREEVFDVSEFIGGSRDRRSSLERRAAEKPDGVNYDDDVKEVTSIMKAAGKAPKWFVKTFGSSDLSTSLWSLGGQKLVDHFDIQGKMIKADNVAFELMSELDNTLKKKMGWKSNVERDTFNNVASVESIDVDTAVDPLTGETITLKISPLVAMNLYLTAQSAKGRVKVLNTFDGNSEAMQKVFDALTPEQKKYADELLKFVNAHWGPYTESFKQEGVDIDVEPYWPFADAVHIALGDRRINSSVGRKDTPNGMISLDVDAREVFNTYIQRVAGAQAHVYATIRRMKDLFGYRKEDFTEDYPTEEFRDLSDRMWENTKKIRGLGLANTGSERQYEKFLALIDDFLAKREASLVGSESLNIAARNLTGGVLQFKPIQFFKNLSNVTGFWGLVEPGQQGQYWKDTAWAATHPIQAAKYMMEKVPYIKERFKGENIDEALTQQTAGTDSLVMNWAKRSSRLSADEQKIVSNVVALTQAARRLGYTPMLSGDLAANVVGGYGLLKQYEAKYGDKAGDMLSKAIVDHQASSNQATRSLLQRQWSRDIRGELSRYTSESIQKVKSMVKAAAQSKRGERTTVSATKEILSTLSSMIVFALLSAGVWDLFDGDDENDEEVYKALGQEGISALVGGSVVGNSIIAPIVSIPFTGGSRGIGTPMTTLISSDLSKLSRGDWDDAVLDGLTAVASGVGMKNLVNSAVYGPYHAITAERPNEVKAGVYQTLGYTENYANKRSGIKKKKVEKNDEE